jgi:phage terminase large subunit
MYYKEALIGVEANFDSYPIRELQRLGYPKQYVRVAPDTYTDKTEKRSGFKTTQLTRPTILSRLVEIVRDHVETIRDRATLEELLTIIKNDRGRVEAPQGGHDDDMMGLAIAHEIRDQVVFPTNVIEVNPSKHFDVEKRNDIVYDFGEMITII